LLFSVDNNCPTAFVDLHRKFDDGGAFCKKRSPNSMAMVDAIEVAEEFLSHGFYKSIASCQICFLMDSQFPKHHNLLTIAGIK
jgi:hypothetical protein